MPKPASMTQNTWIFQSQNREKLSPDEIQKLLERREQRKAKNWTLDPNRY